MRAIKAAVMFSIGFTFLATSAIAQNQNPYASVAKQLTTDGTQYDQVLEGNVVYAFTARDGYVYEINITPIDDMPAPKVTINPENADTKIDFFEPSEEASTLYSFSTSDSDNFYLIVEPAEKNASRQYSISIAALAGICKSCSENADCESGNCGVGEDDSDLRLCIPSGASSYKCSVDDASGSSSGCFMATSSRGCYKAMLITSE